MLKNIVFVLLNSTPKKSYTAIQRIQRFLAKKFCDTDFYLTGGQNQ